jgi:Skp family chaperone for outer membrane proteins
MTKRWSVFLTVIGIMLLAEPLSVVAQTKKTAPFPVPVIGVVDFARTVRGSLAGQGVIAQINGQHAAYQKEIQGVTAELEQSRQELARQQTLLDPKVFSERRAKFQNKARRLQQSVQKIKKQLDATFARGMQKVEVVLADVLSEISKEKGINIIMNAGRVRGTVLFVDSRIVISKEAMSRLNARLPKVELELPPMNKKAVGSPAAPGRK